MSHAGDGLAMWFGRFMFAVIFSAAVFAIIAWFEGWGVPVL